MRENQWALVLFLVVGMLLLPLCRWEPLSTGVTTVFQSTMSNIWRIEWYYLDWDSLSVPLWVSLVTSILSTWKAYRHFSLYLLDLDAAFKSTPPPCSSRSQCCHPQHVDGNNTLALFCKKMPESLSKGAYPRVLSIVLNIRHTWALQVMHTRFFICWPFLACYIIGEINVKVMNWFAM